MNINKIGGSTPLRAERQGDVKTQATEIGQPVDSRAGVAEDKVEFSGRASEVGRLVDQVKQFPEVRQEKVGALRERIASGEYNPSNETIADAILKDERS